MLLGSGQEGAFQVLEQRVIRGDERQVDLNGLVPSGIGKAFSNAITVSFGGDLLAALGPVVLTLGMVHMRQQCRALAQQLGATAQEARVARIGAG